MIHYLNRSLNIQAVFVRRPFRARTMARFETEGGHGE